METNLRDCNGILIKAGDVIRDFQGLTGRVLFTNGAWRYDVNEGRFLEFNSLLLFKEDTGTSQLEIISQPLYKLAASASASACHFE